MSLSSLSLLLATGLAVATGLKGCNNLEVDSEWDVGLSADLMISTDHAGHGWTLELTWDHPLDQMDQWSGTASTTDKQTWTIVNTNDDITAGGTLDIRMVLAFSSHPELISASQDGTTTTERSTTTTEPTTTTPCEGPGPPPPP